MSGQTLSLAFIILYTHRYRELASKYLSQNTIPLGLVRGTYGPLPYIIASLPQSSTVLNEEDALYLIADISWAKANLERIYRAEAVLLLHLGNIQYWVRKIGSEALNAYTY